jgi:ATP-dependent Clp protease ATP-binding subunit ClpA
MTTQPPHEDVVTLRELIDARLDRIDSALARVEVQTTATNGRVTSLEKWQIEELAKAAQHLKDSMQVEKTQAVQRSWTQPVVTGLIVGLVTGISLLLITLTIGTPA